MNEHVVGVVIVKGFNWNQNDVWIGFEWNSTVV